MKAPDVIYLEKFPSGTIGVVWNDNIEDCGSNEPVEYIRKDALMEWIQEVRAIPHDNGITRDLAFQEIVNKLNSM